MPNPYLDYLIDPIFLGLNRRFNFSFKNTTDRTVHIKRYVPIVEIKDYNFRFKNMIIFEKLRLVKEMIKRPVVY